MKIAHKIAKSKYFPNILNDSDFLINFLFLRHKVCWGNLSLSKIFGGEHPTLPHTFILRNCVDGLFYLKNGHMYHYQVQQQLFTTKSNYCDFVVCAFDERALPSQSWKNQTIII